MNPVKPDISVIIPILDEESELTGLLNCLAEQRGIPIEIILCDGGSRDGSLRLIREQTAAFPHTVRTITAPRGRGCQMNAGVLSATSDLLLFLHADSRFVHNEALCTAVSAFRFEPDNPAEALAARFGLQFHRKSSLPSLAYFFYEAKARLNRSDCIRGDQGFLLTRTTFDQLGGFYTSLPFLEDIRLAEAVARNGRWMLIPVEIITSARRFEQEGLYERQVVNAIIANAVGVGWTEFFSTLPGLYLASSESGKLNLAPFLDGIRALLADKPDYWLRNFWHDTGCHISANAWQPFFWLDVRRTFRQGMSPADVRPTFLTFYLNRLEPFFRTGFAGWLAQVAVRIWFRSMLVRGTSQKI